MARMILRRTLRQAAATLFLACLIFSCSPSRKVARYLDREFREEAQSGQFTGLLLVDAQSGDTLFSLNARKYFTPASNVKLFTFYAALKTLPDRVPALKYARRGDTLYVLGTGDPSALHPDLQDSTALRFLQAFPEIYLANENLADPAWGPGWSWDDYDQAYMPGRSAFPLHGNVVRLLDTPGAPPVYPEVFADSVFPQPGGRARATGRNAFFRRPPPGDTLDIPIRVYPELERELWEAVSGTRIHAVQKLPETDWEVLPGMPADSLYKQMLTRSDNFLAEQTMLLVSAMRSDTLSFEAARDYLLSEHLGGLPQVPRWVDGSGLSRYNLFTPTSVVYLLGKLHREFPEPRLFALLARGGEAGTLEQAYFDAAGPFVIGKTGTLSNNHNLSGYLLTRTGKRVLFSFMNNHYREPTGQVKARMQRILERVRDTY